ncbi:MAG: hypothetical protein HYS06_02265 [Methylocystis sp.]|nr:hypothetical protein [Methylocystis sp.]
MHEHLHQLEAGRLARLEALAWNLREEEARLVRYLDSNRGLVAIFPDLVLNRLRTTIQRQKGAAHAVEMQARRTLEQAKRVKQAEKLLANAERDRDREFAKAALSEVVDSMSTWPDVSAP